VKSILKTAQYILHSILEILLPSKCIGCQNKGEILCLNCLAKIEKAEKGDTDILAPFAYHDPLMKKIIWNLKYYHHKNLGLKLGEILYDEMLEDISGIEAYTKGSPILVIPVPISKIRRKKRGYDQAERIAQGFCNSGSKNTFGIKTNIIFKNIETTPQARITNRKRRLKNIKGSFLIKNIEEIKGQNILIIDDVTTTGGTINEIINLLKKNGAKNVYGYAVAH